MNPYQKMAWFQLAVVLFAFTGFLTLYAITGHFGGSLGAFGALGLLGFSPSFLSGRGKEPVSDEYHTEVNRRAFIAAARVTGIFGSAAAMFLMFSSGMGNDIPFLHFYAYLLGEFVVFISVQALATLLIYGADQTERLTLVDRFRRMDKQRKGALLGLFISGFIGTGFFITFLAMHKSDTPLSFQVLFMSIVNLALLSSILQMRHSMVRLTQAGREMEQARRANRVSLIAMLIAGGAAAAGLGLAALLPINLTLTLYHALLGLFYVIWIGMLTPFLVLLMPQEKTSKAEDIQ